MTNAVSTSTLSDPNLLSPEGFLYICKPENVEHWAQVSNPNWEAGDSLLARKILSGNSFNEYCAYANCGVEYRIIRAEDMHKYFAYDVNDRLK